MKITLAIFLSLTLTILLFPQEEENYVQFGFGVSLSSEYYMYNNYGYGENLPVEALPINNMTNISMILKDNYFRIQTSLGYYRKSTEYSGGDGRATSNVRIGLDMAFNNINIESMNLYYGVDLALVIINSRGNSKTDFYVGPAFGGEYMFIKYFSLGGEINLNYIYIGQYNSSSGATEWAISTRGIIYLRWYVN